MTKTAEREGRMRYVPESELSKNKPGQTIRCVSQAEIVFLGVFA